MIRPNKGLVDRLKTENGNRVDGPQLYVRKGDKDAFEMPRSFRDEVAEAPSTSHQLTIKGFDNQGQACNWSDSEFTSAVSRAIRAAILGAEYSPRKGDAGLMTNTNTDCVDGHRPARLNINGQLDLSSTNETSGVRLTSQRVYDVEIELYGAKESIASLLTKVHEKVSSVKN